MIVEHVLVGHRGVNQVAAGSVQHAFRLAGRARGVEDEQWILCSHLFRRAVVIDLRVQIVRPKVAAFVPCDLCAGMPHDNHMFDRRAGLDRSVGVCLERDSLAAAHALVGRDDHVAVGVAYASRQCFGREAAKHDRVNGADSRACQHGHGCLRNHRHVDGDPVAFSGAGRLEPVGEPADLPVQFPVGDGLVLIRLIALPQDGDLVPARFEMAVDAVVAGVQGAVVKPTNMQIGRIVGDIPDVRIGSDPIDPSAVFQPEPFRVLDRVAIVFKISGPVDPRRFHQGVRGREKAGRKAKRRPWRCCGSQAPDQSEHQFGLPHVQPEHIGDIREVLAPAMLFVLSVTEFTA